MSLTELYMKVGADAKPAYKITQPGDPKRQAELLATLPNRHTTINRQDLVDVSEAGLAYNPKKVYLELFDVEMSLGMGG